MNDSTKKWLDEDVAFIITDQERTTLDSITKLPGVAAPSLVPDAKPTVDNALLESKLSSAIFERFDCWNKQGTSCKTAPDGQLDVQLFLTENPLGLLEKLKAMGLHVSQVRSKEKVVIGRVSLDKLTEIAKLDVINFISAPRR